MEQSVNAQLAGDLELKPERSILGLAGSTSVDKTESL